jgi:hypothetical protein
MEEKAEIFYTELPEAIGTGQEKIFDSTDRCHLAKKHERTNTVVLPGFQ